MMKPKTFLLLGVLCSAIACTKIKTTDEEFTVLETQPSRVKEDVAGFREIASIDIGDAGAAEITAYDEKTQRLFVVNNSGINRIDVLDFSNPTAPTLIDNISIEPYGGMVNSVSCYKGMLAAAIESNTKTDAGKVVVFNTADLSEVKVIPVGALPDMITYSPDGKYILTANEGEPNNDYTIDPLGTVSVISVKDDYAVSTLDFSHFENRKAELQNRGLRIFGPGATLAQDIEPEYVTISEDSRTAWVTLQENNAIAKIDLLSKTIIDIFPLGFKSYNLAQNAIDPRDGGGINFGTWPVFGMYQPDAIAVLEEKGVPYLFTANEGDAREYTGINPLTGKSFVENLRISSGQVILDPAAFPNAATLKIASSLGRLNITKSLGDTDGDGDFDQLYSFGARSFSVWNGLNGSLIFDSGNELDVKATVAGIYDDNRSDDKGVEPEGLAIGEVAKRKLAFVGLERADAVAVYDVTDPSSPRFLQLLQTGDAPEGILFISDKDSPNKRSLLVVSSENDGTVKVYMPDSL